MVYLDDNDPFESILREFFGDPSVRRNDRGQKFIRGEEEDRVIDFIEDENNVYLVFELPGFHEKDIKVIVKGKELEITAHKFNGGIIQEYLHQKLKRELHLKKQLPNFVNPKGFSYTMKNGVLEMIFIKYEKGNIDER